jgi:hydroxymethylglutaryl-CoA lyase
MGFGNPYGDEWNAGIVMKWAEQLVDMGAKILSLSDTIGVSNPDSISYLFKNLIPKFPGIEFGAHLHTQPHNWREKVEAAYQSGCRRFDGALKGYGGCPMAKDDLTGNMPTEHMITYFSANHIETGVDQKELSKSLLHSELIFH